MMANVPLALVSRLVEGSYSHLVWSATWRRVSALIQAPS